MDDASHSSIPQQENSQAGIPAWAREPQQPAAPSAPQEPAPARSFKPSINFGKLKKLNVMGKEPIKLDKIHFGLVAVVFILVLGVFGVIPITGKTTQTIISGSGGVAKTPQKTDQDVTAVLQKLVEYFTKQYDGFAASVPKPAFLSSEGVWTADLDIGQDTVLKVKISDPDLKILSVLYTRPIAVPDLNLPPGLETTGASACSVGGKTSVVQFTDPYCPACIQTEGLADALKQKFGDSIDYKYRILLTHSQSLINQYGRDAVTLASKYFICSQEQGKIDAFKACALDKYKAHYETPLSKTELDACATQASLDATALGSCVAGADAKIAADESLAGTWGVQATPTIVADCQYRTNIAYAENAVCFAAPGTPGC